MRKIRKRVIRKSGANIVTLQEIHRKPGADQVRQLADALGWHINRNVHFDAGDNPGRCDKPQSGKAGNTILSKFTNHPPVARPDTAVGGAPRGPGRQGALLLRLQVGIILTGDFNAKPADALSKRFGSAGWVDTGAKYANGPTLGNARTRLHPHQRRHHDERLPALHHGLRPPADRDEDDPLNHG
ncbi:hypothetical protein E1292_20800 [Nonomuraea deserti]|uniref:Endonuclease/exonuclease/phosphatase domain-containing protein n=1 Tax=Nonomuraea deserti TaxID=1848322 RepID=A0A4R4VDJ2_9ACTN|nr:endonuclease/exonuclease/phosphatase family protein [Nonomuraea deserti]TDD03588.1 hypothetical protein E1292_20800 [Nonomuraea deserti]